MWLLVTWQCVLAHDDGCSLFQSTVTTRPQRTSKEGKKPKLEQLRNQSRGGNLFLPGPCRQQGRALGLGINAAQSASAATNAVSTLNTREKAGLLLVFKINPVVFCLLDAVSGKLSKVQTCCKPS